MTDSKTTIELVGSDTTRPESSSMLANWYFGNWQNLIAVDVARDIEDSAQAQGYLLQCSAHFALGELELAKQLLQQALDQGFDPTRAARILVSGVQTTLARAEYLRGDAQRGKELLEQSLSIAGGGDFADTALRTRQLQELTDLGLIPDAAHLINDEYDKIKHSQGLESEKRARETALASEIELLNQQVAQMQKRQQLYTNGQVADSQPDSTSDQSSKTKKKTRAPRSTLATQLKKLQQKSTSQLGQDIWVLQQHAFKRGGYFVEFGATDGILLSNTFLLESEFGWRGLCAEPNPSYYQQLQENRTCILDDACISGRSGDEVEFILAKEFGGISEYGDKDLHGERRNAYREQGQVTTFTTISLNDFLKKHKAPKNIDYMSVDTEGNELDILLNFDFSRWRVACFSVEHNYSPHRDKIYQLLKEHGYERTEAQWDDWYFLPE